MAEMSLPTFLIIGAARSGTTSLYEYCRQHPQVLMSPRRETNFMVLAGEPVAGDAWSQRNRGKSIDSVEKYARLFAGRTTQTALGEASPRYMQHGARAIANIQRYVPEARLIAILRQPAERAYSHYLLRLQVVKERSATFEGAIEAEARRIQQGRADDAHYVPLGFYYQQLRPYFDAFPAGQMRIYLHDDLAADTAGLLRDLFAFIGVDSAHSVDAATRHHSARDTLVPSRGLMASVFQNIPLARPFFRGRWYIVSRLLRQRASGEPSHTPPLTPEMRARLTAIYREDILKLQDLIGRDLGGWLT
jgi:hypothetical protein